MTVSHQRYDKIPYIDCPISESRPDHLYTIARLFGLSPTPVNRCRVLELGCAAGGNLIPLAYYWPETEFVGVELSQNQAQEGQRLIEQIDLGNVRILQEDLSRIDSATLGKFDYVIAHGVYSWVPAQIRDAMLALCKRVLNPHGIAYISFNTRPGWDLRRMVSDMLQFHNRYAGSETEKITLSRELLTAFAKGLPDNSSLSEQWLRCEAEKLLQQPDSYLLHDYLEPHNQPVYFYEFAQHAEQFDLQYFSDANLYTILGDTLTPSAEDFLDHRDSIADYEQYLDFFYLKHFRQALLCHQDQSPDRELDVGILKQAFFHGAFKSNNEISLHNNSGETFHNYSNDTFTLTHPLTKAAAVVLSMHYPAMLSFNELYVAAAELVRDNGNPALSHDKDALFNEVAQSVFSNAIQASFHMRTLNSCGNNTPKADTLIRTMTRAGRCCVANPQHNSIHLDELDQFVLQRLDGSKSPSQLANTLLLQCSNDGSLSNKVHSMLEDEPNESNVGELLQSLINYWARVGLLHN